MAEALAIPETKAVLVVEDNPGDARLVEFYLKEDCEHPFRVLKADHLAGGLVILAAEPIDVVLLDLSLPDSFGIDTLNRLRAAHPAVPVVVLTGTKDEAVALESLRTGAQDYLVKGEGDGNLVRRAVRYAIERARTDRELRRSEAQFRAVFANAGIGVAMITADGTFLDVNPTFAAMLGYEAAALRGMSIRDITHPDDQDRTLVPMADLVAGKIDGFNLQKRCLTCDGHSVWTRVTVTAVRGDQAGSLRFSVAMVEDITERKRLEDHMRMAATVFENTGDGLFITDADRNIIHVNRAFTELTGYGADEVLGCNPRVLASGRHGADFYERMWHSLSTNGRWQGEIWDRRKSGEMFAGWQNIAAVRNADGEITNFVSVISDITSRKQIEERLSYAANHDPLTRLPNRTLFQERLSRALARAHRNQRMVGLLFIDLDHFKQINDTLGHLAGDLLLQQVAERIGGLIRQGDTLARLSGDEFTVILEDIQDSRDAAIVSHKILHSLAEPFDLSGHCGKISSSIGVALYPSDAGDPQALVKLADVAMYRAKDQGRNGCQFHSETVNAQAFERLTLENGLRHALEREEFELHYQPIFDVRSGAIVAVEALLRWRHPEVGMVVPSQFLPLAEETGLVLEIGQWVLEDACRQVRAWHDMGFPHLQLDVNLSGRQLRQPDIVERVAEALESSLLAPEYLVLEVPESAVIDKAFEPGALFSRLSALGTQLAIDEFGAGLSSFAFLRRLPANALKISQTFVRNVASSTDDAEIVTAILAVARGLHMAVVAPGVETEDQLSFLSTYGCDRVQGFLFARALTADRLTELLKQGQVPPALAKRISAP